MGKKTETLRTGGAKIGGKVTLQFEGLLGQMKIDDSPAVAIALGIIAEFYRSQGRYSHAEPLYLPLSIREKHLGIEHPDTATSLNNLALLYYSMERYEDAEILLMIAETKALFGEHQWMTTLAIEGTILRLVTLIKEKAKIFNNLNSY
jgi:tetratricopeptide (TPR) repeat protein